MWSVGALLVSMLTASTEGLGLEHAAKTSLIPMPEVSADDLANPVFNKAHIEAALASCKWESAGSIAQLTNNYRESSGVWNSSYSIFHPFGIIDTYSVGAAPDTKGGMAATQRVIVEDIGHDAATEVCFAPLSKVTGLDSKGGEAIEHIAFTRTKPITIPVGMTLEFSWVPATPAPEPGTNRYALLFFDWLIDEDGEYASYPPLHPHHTEATAVNYPSAEGLSDYAPFGGSYLSNPASASRLAYGRIGVIYPERRTS
jgi:hypothetical protein